MGHDGDDNLVFPFLDEVILCNLTSFPTCFLHSSTGDVGGKGLSWKGENEVFGW